MQIVCNFQMNWGPRHGSQLKWLAGKEKENKGDAAHGVILFASRSLEPIDVAPYQPLLDSGLIRRFYLDEMPELANAPLGLSILNLIRQTESDAPVRARELVARVKSEVGDEALRVDLIELIETVIIYKLSQLTREEIRSMLQINDIRESRVWKDAKQEGVNEGFDIGFDKGTTNAIAKMAAKKMPAEEIANILELDVEQVRQTIANAGQN
jgi:predicted transposase/invertase (TIGR01784 family)